MSGATNGAVDLGLLSTMPAQNAQPTAPPGILTTQAPVEPPEDTVQISQEAIQAAERDRPPQPAENEEPQASPAGPEAAAQPEPERVEQAAPDRVEREEPAEAPPEAVREPQVQPREAEAEPLPGQMLDTFA